MAEAYKLNAHDYEIKHHDTYGLYKGTPILFKGFWGDAGNVLVKGTTYPSGKTEGAITDGRVSDCEFPPPRRGLVNLASSMIYLKGLSTTQGSEKYKATLSRKNTELIDPFDMERKMFNSPPVRWTSSALLNAIFKNEYPAPMEALDRVISFERIACAFSPKYGFGIKFRPNSVMIFHGDKMIGRVNSADKEILLKEGTWHYFEELSEYGFTVRKVK